MSDKEERAIGPWVSWSRYVVGSLRELSDSIKDLSEENKKILQMMDEFVKRDECKEDSAGILAGVAASKEKMEKINNDIIKIQEQFKSHISNHEYKWKIITAISVILGIIATAITIISKIRGK